MTAANAMDRGVPGAGGQGSETRPVPVGRAADEAPAPEVVAPDVVAREVVAREVVAREGAAPEGLASEVVAREGAAPEVSEAPASRREWLTIHEASDLIGVSPATLRRWSDAGEIRAFTTPGGHRRFARAAVLGLIPAERRDRTGSRLGDIAARIARAYRRIGSGGAADDPLEREGFLARLDEAERAPFREFAATIALALLELVEGAAERDATTLVRAETAAAAFGALAAARAVPLDQTVDAFLGLRRPFLSELAGGACRQGLDVRQTTDLLAVATEAVDHLIAALVRGHEAGRAPAGLSGMREVPPVTPRIP